MESCSLKCLGTGDGWPSADRNRSSYLYSFGSIRILIDCGESVSRALKSSRVGFDQIDRILISHFHSDHVGGFFMLVQSAWLSGRKKELPVHLPGYGIEPLRKMLDTAYLFDELLPFQLKWIPLNPAESLISGPIRIRCFPTRHLDGLKRQFGATRPESFVAYSFLIETDAVRIGHSADIGEVDDLNPLLEKPLDLLVCELAHVEPGELLNKVAGQVIRRLRFVHVSEQNMARRERILEDVAGVLPKTQCAFADDGDELLL